MFLQQLFSHKYLYDEDSSAETSQLDGTKNKLNPSSDIEGALPRPTDVDEAGDGEEDLLGFNYAVLWLVIVAAFVALVSEFLTSSIENAAQKAGISGVFLAAIVLPVVGNASEHFAAVVFSMKGKVDLAISIAVGSSTQVLVCVLPLLIIIAWICNLDLSLNLGVFESSVLVLSVIMVTFAIKDGKSTWLNGFKLIMAFVVISIAFAFHIDGKLSDKHS